ncbi:hypothetical protein JOB18_041956 [Solea senegalensis]|uniref:Uncharacterized protein n=1 Tax=Solea senegalensis TaxID=28829 RepID=A0AAV6SBE7_SOLSE|nr:hypothetical protein JOB18_041956 [Solea senegalensis]
MYKDTVTRTLSFGAISNGTNAPDDFSTARRHSSAGIRALLWATNSAKSFGCSLGSDSQTSRDNICPNILTPDSIPQFTIPSLSLQSGLKLLNKAKEQEDAESEEDLSSSRTAESSVSVSPACSNISLSSSLGLVVSDRRAERCVSDPSMHRRSPLKREGSYPCPEAQHCLDPASKAALSLPHLTKVTTPYGFITLSQSPQMVSEEALLCQTGLRRSTKDEECACCHWKAPDTRTVDITHDSSHRPGVKNRLFKGSADSQSHGRSVKSGIKVSSASSTSTTVSLVPAARQPDSKLKRRFYNVIKKHFPSCH